MKRVGRVCALARFTLLGAWRRWILSVPPALLGLLLLTQLPRIAGLCVLFSKPAQRMEALAQYAEFLEAVYNSYIVFGMVLSIALGALATGGRRLASQLLPVLSRPLTRLDFLLGRLAGNAIILAFYWSLPALLFEAVRLYVAAPVRVAAWAYLTPLLLHLLLLSAGMACGALLSALRGTFSGIALMLLTLLSGSLASSSSGWAGELAALSVWLLPPLAGLIESAAPFASPTADPLYAALILQTLAWCGIFLTVTAWRFERIDFTARLY